MAVSVLIAALWRREPQNGGRDRSRRMAVARMMVVVVVVMMMMIVSHEASPREQPICYIITYRQGPI